LTNPHPRTHPRTQTQVVWKAHAHEKVGVVVQKDGRPAVVEYSEMDVGSKAAVDGAGRLVYGAGNICSHFFTVAFIEGKVLPNLAHVYHAARKKIPAVAFPSTEAARPESENGVKLEAFIFDVFPLSERMALLEVAREGACVRACVLAVSWSS
jgi:UDP-N-acetylglucosamine/UDP-N-acetylgalactosamine diphosphorylase